VCDSLEPVEVINPASLSGLIEREVGVGGEFRADLRALGIDRDGVVENVFAISGCDVGLDADVRGGTGAKPFAEAFPERTLQFGIAEQNVMGAAAGFADSGLLPVVVGFSAFTIMRSHEQLRTAVCYGGRNVKICCSHLGLDVGPDGGTAQMLEDIATCRAIPTLKVMVPACANEIQPMFDAVLHEPGPVYMRIGRSPTPVLYECPGPIEIGKADVLRQGDDAAIIACGSRVAAALEAPC